MSKIDFSKITDIEIDGIDFDDYPDFCDAFICSASIQLEDGSYRDATEEELELINDDGDFVYNEVTKRVF